MPRTVNGLTSPVIDTFFSVFESCGRAAVTEPFAGATISVRSSLHDEL
jgi:hypothetical protein